MNRINLSLLTLFVCVSCAPHVTYQSYTDPVSTFSPRNHDSVLNFDKLEANSINSKKLALEKDIATSDFFNLSENLLALAQLNHHEIEKLGHLMIEAFYSSNYTTTRSPFSKGPYLLAAIGETQANAKDAIFDVEKMLNQQVKMVTDVVQQSETTYDWPTTAVPLDHLVDVVEDYINFLEKKWRAEKLDKRVLTALIQEIQKQLDPEAAKIKPLLLSMSNEKNLTAFIGDLNKIVTQLGFELDAPTKSELQQGINLGKLLDAAKDEKDGLTILIAVWRMLNPAQRKSEFEPLSADLYNFLNGADDGQLDCLAGGSCHLDIITIFAKQAEILPKIKDYGVDKLVAQVNAGAVSFVLDTVTKTVTPLLKSKLPDVLITKIKDGFASEAATLGKISKDLKGFLTPGVNKWAKNYVEEGTLGINGIELTDVHLKLSGSTQISFAKLHGQTTGSATLGSAMSALETRWELLQNELSYIPVGTETDTVNKMMGSKTSTAHTHVKELLSQMNKALAISGFRISDTETFPSLCYALDPDGTANSKLDIQNFINNPVSFVVPNTLVVTDPYHGAPPYLNQLSADVEDQAQLLKGLSRMIYFFRDWEQNSFDRVLGNVKAEDFVTDPQMKSQMKSIDQKFFPKDILFTLFTGNAAVILGNFSKHLSTILLLDEKRNISWENDTPSSDPSAPISAMAALVNIEKSQRGQVASASALAHELDALIEFYQATDGVEKTTASYLIQKDANGKTTLDALLDGRKQVFLLIAAMSNFLTHEMQAADGGIYHSFDLNLKVPVAGPRILKDQVAVLEALTRAKKTVSADAYGNAALDIYYFMNSHLWNETQGFYAVAEGSTSVGQLPDIVEALYSVETLADSMSSASLSQWRRISAPWLTALKEF